MNLRTPSERDRIALIGDLAFALDTTTQFLGKDIAPETLKEFKERNRLLIDKGLNELLKAEVSGGRLPEP